MHECAKYMNARMTRLRFVAGAVGILAFVHSAFVHSQDQPRPTFKTEANYVRVDVFPTRGGVPVADLTADDFELFEDKVPQKIDAFQHIVVRGNVAEDARREPNTVAESRAMLEDPNARLFVVFLDTGHVGVAGSHDIRKPLVDTLNHAIGEDDLVGVMTPEMAATDVTFARKTTTIEGFLARNWPWGERDRLNPLDPVEKNYESCYGPQNSPPGISGQMIVRRREKQTLDALEDLVVYLRGVREERKAILVVTDGWQLYGPSQALENFAQPKPPSVGVVPGTGRLGIGDRNSKDPVHYDDCERDRMALAQLDDREEYRRLLDEANRANASFYPIDPRGLATFDSSLSSPQSLDADAAALRQRSDALRTLAEATDGLAILTNDVAGGLKRVVADVSSYYLLGYYSTGKLDGKFHAITVRVKRPGVQIRARRGFLAAKPAAATASPPALSAADRADADARSRERESMDRVLAPLGNYGRELPLRILAAVAWPRADRAAFWVVGELAPGQTVKEATDVDITLTQPNGGPAEASAHATIQKGARTFRAVIEPADLLPPDDYVIRARLHGEGSASMATDVFRLALPPAPQSAGALLLRRGPATLNRDVPTADLRFRRSEHLAVEVPVARGAAASARLLDRTGKPLPIPVAAEVRDDADGSSWATARLAMAPLAVGEYVVEIATVAGPGGSGRAGGSAGTNASESKRLVAFRVVP
jgi:VWFA-related protein